MNPHIIAFLPNLGTPELIIIGILVLVLFGAKKLPMFARSLGKSIGEFKKAKVEFEDELQRSMKEETEKKDVPSIKMPEQKREPVGSERMS